MDNSFEVKDTVINVIDNNHISISQGEELILSCFRVGDPSSKAFLIHTNTHQQIFSIKEEIANTFVPRIIPRHIKIYLTEEEITPESPKISSLKQFKEEMSQGHLKLRELRKPLKRIADEPILLNQTLRKGRPDALDIIIVDDDLQKSIDNIVYCNSTKSDQSSSSGSSREKIMLRERELSKISMKMEKVEKKLYIK